VTSSTLEFSGRVVHDLKGPLASMRANLQFALGIAGLPVEVGEALNDTLDGIDVLQRILGAVSDIGQRERPLQLRKTTVNLVQLLHRARDASGRRARTMRQELSINAPVTCVVGADADLSARAIATLLDNTLRYAPPGSRITLELRDEPGRVLLRISDDGPSIPESARGRVFEPLGDLDEAMAQLRIGAACSLPFCRRVLEAHGGTLDVEGSGARGNTFVLVWPRTEGL
jgi:signal transduction histidine kinase